MILDKLCKDNVICCDDNCKRCANLIYGKYMEQKAEIERLKNALMGECELSKCSREEEIRAEAIKEFWDRLKQTREFRTQPYVYIADGCDLVKEMLAKEGLCKVEHNSLCETETYKNSK